MKVLHIANVDRMIHNIRLELLIELKRQGYEVHICASPTIPEFIERFNQEGFIFHSIDVVRGLSPLNVIKCSSKIRKLIKKEKFDIIHSHTPTGGMVGRLGAFLAGHNKIFHTTAGLYFHENMSKHKYKFYAGIERYLTSKTQVLFSPNYEDIKTCESLKIVPKSSIVYCGPTGVKLEKYDINNKSQARINLRKELQLENDTLIIGIVARLVFEKGYKEFIDVIARLNQDGLKVHAVSVGAGPEEKEIKAYATYKGVQNISFMGYSLNVPMQVLGFDIFLFPSYREGLPIVTLESMASKVPIVAFKIRGCRESIVDGETGFLVDFLDVDAMFVKTKLLVENKSLRDDLGEKGRNRVETMFTKKHHVDRQLPYYEQFIAL